MGFKDAMKAANFNFGTVDSPDFMACYLAQKDDHFMIVGAQAGTYEFHKEDVVEFSATSGLYYWSQKAAAQYHKPILEAFLDYYIY